MAPPTWPELPFGAWSDTARTLHMWTQVVGKIRMEKTPWINHSWGVTLHPTVRGLTTLPIPDPGGIPNMPDEITREAYSHEVSSAGFWPGGDAEPADWDREALERPRDYRPLAEG